MVTDAKIERIKLNPNLNNANLNQGINDSSFSSESVNIKKNNIETIDLSYINSVNSVSNDIENSETKSVFEKTGATGVSVITSLGEGLGLLGESIVDAGSILSAVQSSVISGIVDGGKALYNVGKGTINAIKNNNNVFDSIKKEFDNYQSLTASNWENTKSFVSNEYVKTAFDDFYENNRAGSWISGTSYGFDNVRNVGSGVGYVGGIVAITVGTLGIGGAALGGSAAASTATTGGLSATMAGYAAAAGLGKGTQNAWNDGASIGKGVAYGTVNAIWEGAQFYAGGQINAIKVGNSAIGNAAVRVGLDTATGAAEGLAKPAMDKIYKDQTYSELFDEAGGWKNVGMQGAIAAGMSAFGETSGFAKKFRYDEATENLEKSITMNNMNNSVKNIEVVNDLKNSYIGKLENIKYDMSKASLEDVTDILNHYGQDSVMYDGVLYHKKINVLEGASLNARYKELTGHDHPTYSKIKNILLDQEIKNNGGFSVNGNASVYESLKNNTIEIGGHNHIINKTSEILLYPEKASLSEISSLLDYYDGKPVLIDGIVHHPFNNPSSAAKLNSRFKELTGHDHPTYYEKFIKGNVK